MLATVADRGPEPLVGRLQELGVGLVPELGVGERGHVALEVLLADALRPLPGAELGGEVGAGAGRERARDALRDRLVRRARLLEAAAQHAGDGRGTKECLEHRASPAWMLRDRGKATPVPRVGTAEAARRDAEANPRAGRGLRA